MSWIQQLARLHPTAAGAGQLRNWMTDHPPDPSAAHSIAERQAKATARHPSQQPRVLYPNLPSAPWFDTRSADLAAVVELIESAHEDVRCEVTALRRGCSGIGFQIQPEAFVPRAGRWNFFYLTYWGRVIEENRQRCPRTFALVAAIEAARNAPGVSGFSTLAPGARVLPHCDPINLRVRVHLGLAIPAGDCRIRVGAETRRWRSGRCIAFDDSFDHATWNNADSTRIIFGVDLWHPALTDAERRYIARLYTEADSPLAIKCDRKAGEIAAALGAQDADWWC